MQKETLCLGLLSLGPRSGYEIKQMFEGPLSDFYSLSFGTIYPTLNNLQLNKYVSCKQHAQSKKPDKKVYTITKKGLDLMKSNLLSDAAEYIRSGNFGDQIKCEFFLLVLFSIAISACQTVSKKIDDTTVMEQKELSKWLNKSELELKSFYGQPDKVEFLNSRNRNYVYVTEKYKIKCVRKFEVNPRNIVIGFISKNCF